MLDSCKNERREAIKRTPTNVIEDNRYRKTFVEDELPDLAGVQSASIDLPLEDARVVLVLWSRVISHGQGRARSLPYVAARFINLIVAARVPRPAGDSLPPLITSTEALSIPDGKTALKRLRIESSD